MSLRYFLKINALPVFLLASSLSGAAYAASSTEGIVPPVQTYVDQAAPAPAPDVPSQEYYNSPLSAGTLTLQDVLEAHKPTASTPTLPAIGATPSSTATAPLLTPSTQSSSTGLMMSQGMKEVLQKVGGSTVPPVQVRTPTAAVQAQAQGQPTPLVQAAPAVPGAPDLKYEPGQEPKNLATDLQPASPSTPSAAAPTSEPPAIPTPIAVSDTTTAAPSTVSSSSSAPTCDEHPQKWEKSCGDAGYPATYVGKIVGETRTSCVDNTLHDVWVTNTCAPPDTVTPAETAKVDAVCGVASNNSFDDAPSANLCAQGNASAVNGSGPWTWACSGINGGAAAACTAPKRMAMVSGVCGAANGVGASSAPATDLCDTGHATSVKGSGPWTWSCKGSSGGSSQSCIAPLTYKTVAAVAPVPAIEAAAEASAPLPAPSPAASSAPVAESAPPAVSEKGELCGAAAETLAYQAPDKDLCRIGNATTVDGNGPWTWSCTDNEGRTSSCRTLSLSPDAAASPKAAPEAPVQAQSDTPSEAVVSTSPRIQPQEAIPVAAPEIVPAVLACGAAAVQPTMQIPTTALCEGGKASAVHGSGPWNWTCSNGSHHKVSCATPNVVDASCGAANGTSLKSAPFGGLCASGTPTAVEGNGPWNWACNGSGGGVTVSCAASLLQSSVENNKVDGTCGSIANTSLPSAPSSSLCNSGAPSAVSGEGPWTWSCSGSNGGAVSTCSAKKIAATQPPGPVVNGLCGTANGATAVSAPVDGLCSSGTATTTAGNGPWNWSCIGQNGGMSVSCTAPLEPPSPVDGLCGAASGTSTLVKPQSGLCSSGITGTVSGKGPWTWTCSGANGGSASSCVAPVAGKSGSMPSMTSTASGPVAAPVGVVSTHGGLVTPQLPSSDMPSLDQQVMPQLTPSKSFASPPSPSSVPPVASVSGTDVPSNVPDVSSDTTPLQPPSLRDTLPSAPVLQETTGTHAATIPGNHLTLDPTVSTVLFSRGSGNIDDTVLTTLDKLSAILNANPDVRVTLTAYADNTDSTPRDARRLSLARALAVRDYLGSRGISDSRIDVRAEGANTTSGYIDRVDVKVND